MLNIERKLDMAFQQLKNGKFCHYCFKKATEIHHLERRANKAHRWDRNNALPVCRSCHNKVHSSGLEEPKIDFIMLNYKELKMNKCLSDREFLELKAKEYGIKYTETDFETNKPKKRVIKECLTTEKKPLTKKQLGKKQEQKITVREQRRKEYRFLKELVVKYKNPK